MSSFFDNRYYRVNKMYMCGVGIWPEQSAFMKFLIPSIITITLISVIVPEVIRMVDVRKETDRFIECIPPLLAMGICTIKLANGSFNMGKMSKIVNRISRDWEYLADSPSMETLYEYADRGRLITLIYSVYMYGSMTLYLILPVMPSMLDIVMPLNESRPKKALFEAEYGVDFEEYFVPITLHAYLGTLVTVAVFVTVDSMYFVNVEHACALFKIVGVNLRLTIGKSGLEPEDYFKTIRYSMGLHRDALSFADMIESNYSTAFTGIIFGFLLGMSLCGVLTVVKSDDPEEVVRVGVLTLAQALSLYLNSVPGQKLIDHSLEVHTMAYDFEWYDMPTRIQKLLVPMMIRSMRPCQLTAGKVYIISMENYSSVMKSAMSYFTVFSSMR